MVAICKAALWKVANLHKQDQIFSPCDVWALIKVGMSLEILINHVHDGTFDSIKPTPES